MSGAVVAAVAPSFSGLVFDFGLGANYAGTQSSANTSVILTVKRDGTWTVTFDAGDTPSGSPTSGTWHRAPHSTVGDNYEVIYAVSNQVGTPVVVNGAAAYTAITGDIVISVSKNGADASADVAPSIRKTGTTSPVLTDTSNFAAEGAP